MRIKIKRKKFSRFHLMVFVLIGVAGLLLVGFTQVRARYSLLQLQQEPLDLPVPVLRQARSTSCGEAVITMAYNYAYPEFPVSEDEVIDYATANGYYTAGMSPFTSPTNMVRIAKHYIDNISSGTVISSGQGLSLLIQRLRHGEPVIIDVLSDFRDPHSEAHFVVVTGISIDPDRDHAVIIHYNDPFTGTKQSDDWGGSEGVWNAWHTNSDPGGAGWWMVISPKSEIGS